jgi:hypothetical protein
MYGSIRHGVVSTSKIAHFQLSDPFKVQYPLFADSGAQIKVLWGTGKVILTSVTVGPLYIIPYSRLHA